MPHLFSLEGAHFFARCLRRHAGATSLLWLLLACIGLAVFVVVLAHVTLLSVFLSDLVGAANITIKAWSVLNHNGVR